MPSLADLEAKLKREGNLPRTDQASLLELVRYYRRLLAMKTAESAFLEMKNFSQIDEEIKPLGYRLVNIVNSRIPVLEEIKGG